jgi:hypothetical protein
VRYDEAMTMVKLGDVHHAVGDHAAAHTAWRQALTLLAALQHPDAGPVTARLDRLSASTGSNHQPSGLNDRA